MPGVSLDGDEYVTWHCHGPVLGNEGLKFKPNHGYSDEIESTSPR